MADSTLDELSSLPLDYSRHPMAMGGVGKAAQPMQTPEWLLNAGTAVAQQMAPGLIGLPHGPGATVGGGGGGEGMPDDPTDIMNITPEEIEAENQAHTLEESMGMLTGMSMETLPPAQMPQLGGAAPVAPPALTGQPGLVSPFPAYQKALAQAQGQLGAAATAQATADEEIAKQEKAHQEAIKTAQVDRADALADQAKNLKAQQEIDAAAQESARQKIQRATDMVMDKTINTRRLLPTTSAKMGAAIAIGLGQFGATLTGTPNAALQMLETAIDRDIAAQKVDIDNLKFGVQVAQSDYSMLMDVIQDRRQTDNIIRQVALQEFNFKLDQLATKFNIDSHDSRIAKIKAQTQARTAELNLQLRQMEYAAAYENYALNRQIQATKEAASLKAGSLEFRPKIQEKLTYAQLAEGQIAELEDDIQETNVLGGLWPGYNLSEKYQDNLKGLASTLVRMYSGAAATNEEAERIASRLGGYFTMEGTKKAKLAEVKKEMQILKAALYESMSGPEQALFYSRFGDPREGLKGNDLRLMPMLMAGERDAITTPSASIAAGVVIGPAE